MALHQLMDILFHQGIWPFLEQYSPAMYPIVLVAFTIALVLILRDVVTDVYYVLQGKRSLWRSLRIDLQWLALDVLAISLLWWAFATPYDRLPFYPPPAGSGWYAAYVVTAVVLHGALALFPTQFMIGVWIARLEFPSPLTQRFVYLGSIVCAAIAVYGWEIQRWPGEFTVPAELYLVFGFSVGIGHLIFGDFSTSAARLRVQHGVVTVLLVAGFIVLWLYHGIGLPQHIDDVIRSHDNPTLYPFALAALGTSVLIGLLNFVVLPRNTNLNQRATEYILGLTLILFALELLAIYLVWLAFSTPVDRLPFAPPAGGGRWLFIPLDGIYIVSAVLVHAVISLFGVSNLLTSWGTILLRLRSGRAPSTALAYVGFALTVAGWEVQHWPLWLIVPIELLLAYLISSIISDAIDDAFDRLKAGSPQAKRRVERVVEAFESGAILVAVVFITFHHNISSIPLSLSYPLTLLGLYFTVVALEKIVALCLSIRQAHQLEYQYDNPRRWRITILLVPLLALLGASGVFNPLIANPSIGRDVWIEVGAVGTAYVLFKPLIDLAAKRASALEQAQPKTVGEILENILPQLGQVIPRLGPLLGQRLPQRQLGPGAPASAQADTQAVAGSGAVAGVPSVAGPLGLPEAARQEPTPPLVFKTARELLDLHVIPLFFVAALLYHYMIRDLHLSSLLNGAFLPLVFGLAALVAGLLPLLEERVFAPARYVSLLLIFVILIVTVITILFTVVPHSNTSLTGIAPNANPLQVLGNQAFLSAVGAAGFLELLVLLTVGQLGYLYIVVEATIRRQLEEPNIIEAEKLDEDLATFAEWHMGKGHQDDGLDYYQRSLAVNKDNDRTWRRMGLDLQRQGRYDAALSAYEHACDIAPEVASYWNDKGVALSLLGRYEEAIAAFERALQADPNYALAADYLGDMYTVQGHFEEAAETYRRAAVLDPRNPIYADDLGGSLSNLRHYEEALRAFNVAFKLNKRRALTLRNKAELLLKGLKRYNEAVVVIKQAIRLDSNSLRAWAICGLAYQALGNAKEAQAAFDRALRLDPAATATWASRGDVLVALGRYADALKDYDRALRTYPHDPDVWQGKAAALRGLGREVEAREAEGHNVVSSKANPWN